MSKNKKENITEVDNKRMQEEHTKGGWKVVDISKCPKREMFCQKDWEKW